MAIKLVNSHKIRILIVNLMETMVIIINLLLMILIILRVVILTPKLSSNTVNKHNSSIRTRIIHLKINFNKLPNSNFKVKTSFLKVRLYFINIFKYSSITALREIILKASGVS